MMLRPGLWGMTKRGIYIVQCKNASANARFRAIFLMGTGRKAGLPQQSKRNQFLG
jgi:hypothetical protein